MRVGELKMVEYDGAYITFQNFSILAKKNLFKKFLKVGKNLIFIGNAFDAIVSLVAYAFLLNKKKINILDIE